MLTPQHPPFRQVASIQFRLMRWGTALAAVLLLAGCADALAALPASMESISPPQPNAAALLPTLTPEPGGQPKIVAGADQPDSGEVRVRPIPLAGPAAQRNAELSGLAWYRDTLILLPQYPAFTEDGQSALYALPKSEIAAFLNGEMPGPLEPRPVAFTDWGVPDALPGFEGYEAIAFAGDRVFVTTEVNNGVETAAYLVGGYVNPDDASIALDASVITYIPPQTGVSNHSDESLLLAPDGTLITLYELNGAEWNPAPLAHRFDAALRPLAPVPFPSVEYRVTDATEIDGDGRFWVINYFFPGDDYLAAAHDPLAAEYGEGATHQAQVQVERLVEYQYDGAQIVRTDRAPVQLHLTLFSRNWEGIVRLDEPGGFLIATDQFPETVLGFVAVP